MSAVTRVARAWVQIFAVYGLGPCAVSFVVVVITLLLVIFIWVRWSSRWYTCHRFHRFDVFNCVLFQFIV